MRTKNPIIESRTFARHVYRVLVDHTFYLDVEFIEDSSFGRHFSHRVEMNGRFFGEGFVLPRKRSYHPSVPQANRFAAKAFAAGLLFQRQEDPHQDPEAYTAPPTD